jgi:hypothetical protein
MGARYVPGMTLKRPSARPTMGTRYVPGMTLKGPLRALRERCAKPGHDIRPSRHDFLALDWPGHVGTWLLRVQGLFVSIYVLVCMCCMLLVVCYCCVIYCVLWGFFEGWRAFSPFSAQFPVDHCVHQPGLASPLLPVKGLSRSQGNLKSFHHHHH